MARIEDMPLGTREAVVGLACPEPKTLPWVRPRSLGQSRIAILTSAALHRQSEMPFPAGTAEYRELPAMLPASDIRMSHISINFDRAGFQRDINVAYPIDRLKELAAEGALVMRYIADDMKALYMEAVQAIGQQPSGAQINRWFWNDTLAAELLRALRSAALTSEHTGFKTAGSRFLVPAPHLTRS